ncbi:NADH:quinone oxidoreductase [Pseudomonas fluorescens]|uniref:NADH:quinone oxidoreductase n=1 Tax=Pseudomonas fluorescens TaxID=294 RepID=A0AAP8Z0K1_PSEFL|nr:MULTISPECIES: Rnf-Nqr domain containing protein [Pseudomonas]MBY8958758.1 NADH:quinone oxidoreductase [Pseudomonas sp. MIS38]QBX43126.1 NADH:quinone oxidoreductase [Pseudomonas fluorescens]
MIRPTNLTNTLMLMLLLGTSATLAGALGMLLMSSVVVAVYGACIGPLRSRLSGNNLMLASLLLAATLTSCANILAQRWALQWQQSIGIYAGLIALQCVVLEYNGFFRQAFGLRLTFFGLSSGLLLALAVLRELFGQGHIGRGLSEHWQGLVLFSDGLHLLTLVPGAFIVLGLLLAARQAWTRSTALSKETHHP